MVMPDEAGPHYSNGKEYPISGRIIAYSKTAKKILREWKKKKEKDDGKAGTSDRTRRD